MSTRANSIATLAALLLSLLPPSTQASVVLTGTRVIYDAARPSKTIQFTNRDSHPNLVQVWLDRDNPNSTAETADAPFAVMPNVFRVEPRVGQMVRLVFTGADLPQDRESVFYLNFNQIPAMQAKDREANKLVLMFGSRLKLFYRPKGLAGSPSDIPGKMAFALHSDAAGVRVQVRNPTPYYAMVRTAVLETAGGETSPLVKGEMVPPMSDASWDVPPGFAVDPAKTRIKLVLVNDHGAEVVDRLPLR